MTKIKRLVVPPVIAALWAAIGAGEAPAAPATAASDEELLAGAEARIEKYRKAPVRIAVVDAAGRPVGGAKVAVEQTRHAFLFGCNIFNWGRLPTPELEAAYRKRFAHLLNYATLPFYWPQYEPQRGRPEHERTGQVAQWCKDNGILTKGHPLAWNMGDPPWLPDDLEEIRRLQMARIEDCVKTFAGLIDRWDVVNEATHFDRPDFITRRAPKHSAMWAKVGRIEFARECFEHARKAGPGAVLLINDYRTDPPYEKVIEGLIGADGKRLYEAIGIQSHMHGGVWPSPRIWDVCERFSRFGVPLHFTETTVVSGPRSGRAAAAGRPAMRPAAAPAASRPAAGGATPQPAWEPTTPEGEERQAREVVRFYTMLFSHPAVEAVTWWDFSDFRAWQGAPAGFLRKDMTPKPAYEELRKLIKGKWWTAASLETDSRGEATFGGFLGDYKVRITIGGQTRAARDFTLAKAKDGKEALWTVKVEKAP